MEILSENKFSIIIFVFVVLLLSLRLHLDYVFGDDIYQYSHIAWNYYYMEGITLDMLDRRPITWLSMIGFYQFFGGNMLETSKIASILVSTLLPAIALYLYGREFFNERTTFVAIICYFLLSTANFKLLTTFRYSQLMVSQFIIPLQAIALYRVQNDKITKYLLLIPLPLFIHELGALVSLIVLGTMSVYIFLMKDGLDKTTKQLAGVLVFISSNLFSYFYLDTVFNVLSGKRNIVTTSIYDQIFSMGLLNAIINLSIRISPILVILSMVGIIFQRDWISNWRDKQMTRTGFGVSYLIFWIGIQTFIILVSPVAITRFVYFASFPLSILAGLGYMKIIETSEKSGKFFMAGIVISTVILLSTVQFVPESPEGRFDWNEETQNTLENLNLSHEQKIMVPPYHFRQTEWATKSTHIIPVRHGEDWADKYDANASYILYPKYDVLIPPMKEKVSIAKPSGVDKFKETNDIVVYRRNEMER